MGLVPVAIGTIEIVDPEPLGLFGDGDFPQRESVRRFTDREACAGLEAGVERRDAGGIGGEIGFADEDGQASAPAAGTMVTLSPQPQASVWFGLLNTKRAESFSVT